MPHHYLVRRSRLGRFNFTLLAQHGRITGVVTVPTENRSKAEVERAAHEKIRALAAELAVAAGALEPASGGGPASGEA
ncbi:hypothetical protein [uncultured Methylobacterium sp.]|uniref:hypothetical protein n=1 Tax=uncultured Methylobacterium sp. TaxID=157278 RepID=UPI0035C96AAE